MFAAYPVPSVSALVAPQRPKRRSRYPFGNSCNDIRRQKSVLRRPSSVLYRISNHPRSSSDPPLFNKPRYVGPVGATNEYMIGTDDPPSCACHSSWPEPERRPLPPLREYEAPSKGCYQRR